MLHDNCGLEDVEFNAVSIIFGNQKFDKLLKEINTAWKTFHFSYENGKENAYFKYFFFYI